MLPTKCSSRDIILDTTSVLNERVKYQEYFGEAVNEAISNKADSISTYVHKKLFAERKDRFHHPEETDEAVETPLSI